MQNDGGCPGLLHLFNFVEVLGERRSGRNQRRAQLHSEVSSREINNYDSAARIAVTISRPSGPCDSPVSVLPNSSGQTRMGLCAGRLQRFVIHSDGAVKEVVVLR